MESTCEENRRDSEEWPVWRKRNSGVVICLKAGWFQNMALRATCKHGRSLGHVFVWNDRQPIRPFPIVMDRIIRKSPSANQNQSRTYFSETSTYYAIAEFAWRW
jgi:hypothetical protein